METKHVGFTEWLWALRETAGPTAAERGIWIHHASRADLDTGMNIYTSQTTVAALMGCGRDTVRKHINAAVRQGWLSVTGKTANEVVTYRLSIPLGEPEEVQALLDGIEQASSRADLFKLKDRNEDLFNASTSLPLAWESKMRTLRGVP